MPISFTSTCSFNPSRQKYQFNPLIHPFILSQLKGEKPEQIVLDTQLSYSSSFHDVVLETEDALRIYVHGNAYVGDFAGDIVIKDLER